MRKAYDAVIVGGGHNGLICAAYLAKAGRRVLVLERRHVLGGSAVTEELYPGFKFSVCSYVVSLFRPSIIRELALSRHGMEIIPLETSYSPLADDPGLCRWADGARSRREISRFSARDAEVYPEFSLTMTKMAQLTRSIIDAPAPDPTSWNPKELWKLLRLGRDLQRGCNRLGPPVLRALDLLLAATRGPQPGRQRDPADPDSPSPWPTHAHACLTCVSPELSTSRSR